MPDPEIARNVVNGARHGFGGMLTAAGTIITGTAGAVIGAFRTFATKKELDEVKKEQSMLAMTLRDDIRGVHEKIDRNQSQLLTVLLDIKGK